MTCMPGEDKVINKDWACRSGIEMRENCIKWNALHKLSFWTQRRRGVS